MNAKQINIINQATQVRGRAHQYAVMFPAGELGTVVSNPSEAHNYLIVQSDSTHAIVGVHAFTLDYLVNGEWIAGNVVEAMTEEAVS